MIVAIHQPNFFPWLGYFDKIARADIFCLLDNVQFPKTGGTWMNRVRLCVRGEAAWVTAPVARSYAGLRTISEIQFDKKQPWRTSIDQCLRENYSKAPFFGEVFPAIGQLIANPTDCLSAYNIRAVRRMCELLELADTKLVTASTLGAQGKGTDLLINITCLLNGSAYLCGGGAEGYQEDEKFAAAGVRLIYQKFQHPRYPQRPGSDFIPGLSIIDVLMNCGFQETTRLIKQIR